MADAVKMKSNGAGKELQLIPRGTIKLAEAHVNRWFCVLTPEQFDDRRNGRLWAAKSQEFRRYDKIFCVNKDETEAAELLVTDAVIGHVSDLVELFHVKLPPKLPIAGARIPAGYAPQRDVHGYRMLRLSDNIPMTPYHARLEDAVRALLDHASLREIVR